MKKIQYLILLMLLFSSGLYAQSNVQQLNANNFQETIEKHDVVLVSFSAPWCGSCQKMKPKYENVAKKFQTKALFAEVNTDEQQALASQFRITNVPTTVLFKNGKEQHYYVGSLDEEEIELFVNPTEIVTRYTTACASKDALACRKLALFYDDGIGLKADKILAAKFYEQGCLHQDIKSCFNVAYMYDLAEGIPEDNEKAAQRYTKACQGDHRVACHNLALMYEEGEGVQKDSLKAMQLYDQACQLAYGDACYNLALIYQNGEVVPKDLQKAKNLYGLSCKEGDDEACEEFQKLTN